MGARQAGKVAGMSASAEQFRLSGSSKILDTNERLDRLVVVVEAMWSLLEESGYTKEQLDERIRQMDLRDGIDDGRVQRQRVRCPNCDSMVVAGTGHCQICGTEVGDESPFAGI